MRTVLIVACLFIASHAARAADDEPQCNPNGNQMEMNACALRDYKAADAALNSRYQAVMAGLPEDGKRTLRDQQRAWLKKRDPTCKAATKGSAGGSIWPLEYYSCLQAATERRTRALDALGAH
jgi:uncharacterized protein YecT (DUF1311 family)